MKKYNRLLERQLKKHNISDEERERLAGFLDAVQASYSHYEEDRVLIERSMDINSKELLESNSRLREKTESLDNFIYRISHDLKSPVNNIVSLANLLNRTGIDPDSMTAQVVSRIQKSSEQLLEKISETLSISRSGNFLDMESEQCDIRKVVDVAKVALSQTISDNDAILSVDIQGAGLIEFPPQNLESIVQNLISNAIKYRKPEVSPKLEISWQNNEDGGFIFSVKDNGLGMDLEKISGKIFQLHNRFHSHVEGTGIGLYLVKKMVEANGGNIELKSELGVGSEFIVHLLPYPSAEAEKFAS